MFRRCPKGGGYHPQQVDRVWDGWRPRPDVGEVEAVVSWGVRLGRRVGSTSQKLLVRDGRAGREQESLEKNDLVLEPPLPG